MWTATEVSIKGVFKGSIGGFHSPWEYVDPESWGSLFNSKYRGFQDSMMSKVIHRVFLVGTAKSLKALAGVLQLYSYPKP